MIKKNLNETLKDKLFFNINFHAIEGQKISLQRGIDAREISVVRHTYLTHIVVVSQVTQRNRRHKLGHAKNIQVTVL